MKILNKTVLALSLTTIFATCVAQAAISSGTANVEFKGKIIKENSCSINLSEGGLVDVGIVNALDLPENESKVLKNVRFTTNIDCLFDTAVAVKFGASLEPSVYNHMYADVKTPNGIVAAHSRLGLRDSIATVDGINYSLAFIGGQALDAIDLASSTIHEGQGQSHDILIRESSSRGVLTFVDKSNKTLVSGRSFSFPFEAEVVTRPTSEWINDVEGELILNHTATLEAFIL